MKTLTDNIWVEKYRPASLNDLVLDKTVKDLFAKYKDNPTLIPSFIFYSTKPGTGKTSTARVLKNEFGCDFKEVNSSDDRGIDTIREQVKLYVRSLAMNDFKRCIFLDEADGLTPQAQDSLKNLMETYSDNCFFILSCNNINKIIPALKSRCTLISFEKPAVGEVFDRAKMICQAENVAIDETRLMDIVDAYYPDMRAIISYLQEFHLSGGKESPKEQFERFLSNVKKRNTSAIYEMVYGEGMNVEACNTWFFHKMFDQSNPVDFELCKTICLLLADSEKAFNLGVNKEVVFITNMLKISEIIK